MLDVAVDCSRINSIHRCYVIGQSIYIYIHLYLVSLTIFDLLYIFREKQMIYFAFKLSLFLPISLISIFHLDYILRCVFEKWPNVTLHCLRYLCRLCFLYHIINFASVAEFAQLLYRFVESFLFPSNHLIFSFLFYLKIVCISIICENISGSKILIVINVFKEFFVFFLFVLIAFGAHLTKNICVRSI